MAQERIGQLWGAANPLDALMSLVDHLGEGRAGEVGQLDGLEVGPQPRSLPSADLMAANQPEGLQRYCRAARRRRWSEPGFALGQWHRRVKCCPQTIAVERRACGGASSVMARACASAVGMVARGRTRKVGSGAARTGRKRSASSATATGRRGSASTSRARAFQTGRYACRILILKCCPRPQICPSAGSRGVRLLCSL
jgi:hypothetical protein